MLIAIAAAFGVALAALVLLLAPSLLQAQTQAHGQTVNAKVVTTAPCDGGDPHDTVSYIQGGQQHRVQLNGCGAETGSTMRIVLPTDGEQYATTVDTSGSNGSSRLAFVLLAVAGIGGGLVPGLHAPVRRSRPSRRRADDHALPA